MECRPRPSRSSVPRHRACASTMTASPYEIDVTMGRNGFYWTSATIGLACTLASGGFLTALLNGRLQLRPQVGSRADSLAPPIGSELARAVALNGFDAARANGSTLMSSRTCASSDQGPIRAHRVDPPKFAPTENSAQRGARLQDINLWALKLLAPGQAHVPVLGRVKSRLPEDRAGAAADATVSSRAALRASPTTRLDPLSEGFLKALAQAAGRHRCALVRATPR